MGILLEELHTSNNTHKHTHTSMSSAHAPQNLPADLNESSQQHELADGCDDADTYLSASLTRCLFFLSSQSLSFFWGSLVVQNASFQTTHKITEFHALLNRGQALNAYEAKMHLDNGTLDFGHGLGFESGKTKKAEKRPPTQIEIMASMEREKQAKKEERRLAREAKKQARLEQEEFIRNGGNIKLSKKEKRRLEAEMEN